MLELELSSGKYIVIFNSEDLCRSVCHSEAIETEKEQGLIACPSDETGRENIVPSCTYKCVVFTQLQITSIKLPRNSACGMTKNQMIHIDWTALVVIQLG